MRSGACSPHMCTHTHTHTHARTLAITCTPAAHAKDPQSCGVRTAHPCPAPHHSPGQHLTPVTRTAPPAQVAQFLTYPIDTIRTRLAVSAHNTYQGILHAAYCMRRDEGVAAFYRGLVPSMIGILPYAGAHQPARHVCHSTNQTCLLFKQLNMCYSTSLACHCTSQTCCCTSRT